MSIPKGYRKVRSGVCKNGDWVVCVRGDVAGYEDWADALIGRKIPYTDKNYPIGNEWNFYRRPYNTKVAAARRVGLPNGKLPGAPTARAGCRVSARATHGGQHVAAEHQAVALWKEALEAMAHAKLYDWISCNIKRIYAALAQLT